MWCGAPFPVDRELFWQPGRLAAAAQQTIVLSWARHPRAAVFYFGKQGRTVFLLEAVGQRLTFVPHKLMMRSSSPDHRTSLIK